MIFNSYQFLLFFPIVVLIYYLIPMKGRSLWLLIASYYFYMCWDVKYVLLLVLTTFITYLCGLGIERIRDNNAEEEVIRRKCGLIIAIAAVLGLGVLVFYKYSIWLLENISLLLGRPLESSFSLILPIGISFFTFQALGYVIDVYRGHQSAETNFIKYALFVSFFPTLLSGPIERAKNLLSQLECNRQFNYDNVKSGLLIMLWGYFEKIVIADKAAIIVDSVYNNYAEYDGAVIIVATVLFSIQIYCDFGGYSHIAIGAAKVLNVNLMDNFHQPYLARNIKEFWARWHISLSSWFRDYLYIPLGGSRCSRIKKYRNLMITFLVSGLWHGASWHYVVWGALHGAYQVIADCSANLRKKLVTFFKIRTDCFSYRLFQRIVTFSMVSFIWLFFRADNMSDAIGMCNRIIVNLNPTILLGDVVYGLGLNQLQVIYLFWGIVLLFAVDFLHEKKISIVGFLREQNTIFRWGVYYLGVLWIIASVIQTFGQSAGTFIYFQF